MLAEAVTTYVAVRRATGYAFRSEATLLQSFAAFADARSPAVIRTDVHAPSRAFLSHDHVQQCGSATPTCKRRRCTRAPIRR